MTELLLTAIALLCAVGLVLAVLLVREGKDLDQALRQRDGHRYRAARYRQMHRHARDELLGTRRLLRAHQTYCGEMHAAEVDPVTDSTRYWPTRPPRPVHLPFPANTAPLPLDPPRSN
jgi:hypothetical protein